MSIYGFCFPAKQIIQGGRNSATDPDPQHRIMDIDADLT
jgi:hypothetical protein